MEPGSNNIRSNRLTRQDVEESGGGTPCCAHHGGGIRHEIRHSIIPSTRKKHFAVIATTMILVLFYPYILQSMKEAIKASHPDNDNKHSSLLHTAATGEASHLDIAPYFLDSKKKIDDVAQSAGRAAASATEAAQAAAAAATAAAAAALAANNAAAANGHHAAPDLGSGDISKPPNEGRESGVLWNASGGIRPHTGARSKYYGEIQQQHQEWLTRKVEAHKGGGVQYTAGGDPSNTTNTTTGATEVSELEERVLRASIGVNIWGETYVPPIEPVRRQGLIDKWLGKTWSSSNKDNGGADRPLGRILYVISSFDRGERLGHEFTKFKDKLDYMLMMMDEMREACEVGFSPQVHLIAAWDPSGIAHLMRDRLFCERIGSHVPFSFKEYPHDVGDNLSVKHRIYMKPRLEDFDIFLQVEDDMVLTLNHILLYQEESELLDSRTSGPNSEKVENNMVPGFIRVEPGFKEGGAVSGDNWVEWEIMLTRFSPIKIAGAGPYLTMRKSVTASDGGNNQGLWMATREQLRTLSTPARCNYLNFDENSRGNPETHSGSIQMFANCGFDKVFPATHFEDFLVHHRANNKADRRGESIPAVRIRTLRTWVEQFLRDDGYMRPQVSWTID